MTVTPPPAIGDIPGGGLEAAASDPPVYNRGRIAANFFGLTTTNVIGLLVGLLVSVYVRRTLGPEAFGQFSWAAAVLGYIGMIASPGLAIIAQLEIARDHAASERITSVVFTLQMLLATVAYAIVVAVAALDPRGPTVSAILLLQGLLLFAGALDPCFIVQGRERNVVPAVIGLVLIVLQVPFLLLFVQGPGDLVVYAALGLPFAALNLIFRLWYVRREGLLALDPLRPMLTGVRKILNDAWPLALTQGAIMIFYNCDTVILGFTHGDAAVGQYASAYKLMLVSTAISGALTTAYFPSLCRAHDSPAHATTVAREFTTLMLWLGLPLATLGWAFGRHVVDLLYGPEFSESGVYFEWLCLNVALIFLNVSIGTPLTSWGLQRTHLKITATAAAINLALNLWLIPIYGPWAAVATTIGSEVLIAAIAVIVRRRIGLGWSPLLPVALPPLLGSLAVALFVGVLPDAFDAYWWLECALAVGLFALALLAFERRLVGAALRLLKPA